ncbi:MAG TPA: hypothetical protein VK892_12870, partial [Pyrinomonadaceae bacterium]|nr:hypothetical protein [Pyrinomonadaceae bacterium]
MREDLNHEGTRRLHEEKAKDKKKKRGKREMQFEVRKKLRVSFVYLRGLTKSMIDLEEKLAKISPNERRILQCLSIFREQINGQEFQKLLRVLGLKTPEGKAYSAQYLSLFRNSLIHKGFLQNTKEYWGSGFQIKDAELKEFFTREARREDWFDETVAAIQANFPLSEFSSWYNRDRFGMRLLRDYRLSIYQKDAEEAAQILEQIVERDLNGKSSARARETAEKLKNELGFEPVGNLIPPLADWERALNTLLTVAEKVQGKTEKKAKPNETRVAWLLDFQHREIQPVEQKFSKNGWTSGRNIALKRLFERDVKNLTEQDSLVVKTAMNKHSDYYYYGGYTYEFDWEKSLSALVGHPFLFSMKNPGVNLQLVEAEPNLTIRQTGDAL